MLCQFTFKNFKSYRDEAVFDMQAAHIEEFSESLIPAPCKGFSPLLPVSAIYGPNAGGKSNALGALVYLISRVLTPIKASTDYRNPFGMFLSRYSPFALDEESKNLPTEFEVFFRTKSAQYQYNLAIMKNAVMSESLYYVKIPCERRRSVMLFEREGSEIELGAPLKKANVQQISESIPYLSFLFINFNFPEITDAVGWFKNCCMINYGATGKDHRFSSLLDDSKLKPLILDMLSKMDIPISDYEILEETTDDGVKSHQIITVHRVGDRFYKLDLLDESEGTMKILSALPAVVVSLITGGVLIVDELDAKLHPQLLRFLIRVFTNSEVNSHHAQLVFTCHDLSIMKNDLLRRDEIWFAARNREDASELWSLYDLRDEKGDRIKNTAAYDKQYLAGRYGADPYLRQMLDWGDHDGQKFEAT